MHAWGLDGRGLMMRHGSWRNGTANVGFVRGLGAGVVLANSRIDVVEWVNGDGASRGFVVLDCVGGLTFEDAELRAGEE